jgi:hypothetical protein
MNGKSNKQHEERAVRDAQNLVAYLAKSGKELDDETLKTLIDAAEKWDAGEWTPEFALEFWKAFAKASEVIKPATVDSVRAITVEPKKPGIRGSITYFIGKSPALRMTNTYTIFTLGVLLVLLFFQVYWVIGSSLDSRLSELLENEVQLAITISELQQDYDEVELRFKITEAESFGLTGNSSYNFYYTPDWERETLHISDSIDRLEDELNSIRSQLDRNNNLLLVWAIFWRNILSRIDDNEALTSQIAALKEQIQLTQKLIDDDPDGLEEIQGMKIKLDNLTNEVDGLPEDLNEAVALRAQLQNDIAELTQSLAKPDLGQQIINQRKTNLEDLNSKVASLQRQNQREKTTELSRRARLSAGFVLDILKSYILPLLYGLLGASAYVLRTMSLEIEEVKYSVNANRGYVLRLALGTLAGLIVGWFIFLLPGQTFLASISPFAIAFLVGYNIELIFSVMDNLIKRLSRTGENGGQSKKIEKSAAETTKPEEGMLEDSDETGTYAAGEVE